MVCSYFRFVVHNENCCEVSQVYCYQQVPVLANVSHCFHVLLQPIKVFKPPIAVTHNTVFVFFVFVSSFECICKTVSSIVDTFLVSHYLPYTFIMSCKW